MVGMVLVSHSQSLALALKDMVDRLYGGKVPVAVAAGADEGRELGTDATAIMAAVEQLDTSEGVLVLLDLGSALLSAELALDLLDESTRSRVTLCPAPLVEGAVAAAAQISIGAPLTDVRAEAEGALRQKQEQLGGPVPGDSPVAPPALDASDAQPASVELRVENPHGLHARPAMRIVQTAARFPCAVQIANLRTDAPPASARSLVAINCLDARRGDTIRITARGGEAPAAIAALSALHAEHFGDEVDEPPAPEAPTAPPEAPLDGGATLRGKPLSDGVVIGRLVFADHAVPELPPPVAPVDPATETRRLRDALAAVGQRLGHEAAALATRLGRGHAAILEAHRLLAEDPALAGRAEALITDQRLPAAHAWRQAAEAVAATYRALPDPLWRERARDVEDLGLQVLRELGFGAPLRVDLSGGAALLAVSTLLPSEIASFDWRQLRGVIAEALGPTSHAAILLRAAGVAVVDGVATEALRQAASAGSEAALDGNTGEVWLAPDEPTRARLEERVAVRRAGLPPEGQPLPATRTRDGRRIELAANAGGIADAAAARRQGAEAIGLLRTEFLFLDRPDHPEEQEQLATLRAIADHFPPDFPLTVRTLDIGGDKPVRYLPTAREANPFLGVRGLRLTLAHEELFLTHLRAILRAAHGHRFRVMFPMVTDLAELRAARRLLSQAHEQLAREALPHAWPVETGMMIEVPAAALNAPLFAPEVDFFSVGTNDLTQYTLAAERGHPELSHFADALHPAVLRLIARVAGAAARRGKWVGVCGEAAADPPAARVFVGLGVTELSMGADALPKIHRLIADLNYPQARAVARRCLAAPSADAARQIAGLG